MSTRSTSTGRVCRVSFSNSYLLQDELGRGGFGFVYRCSSKKSCRVYAVKVNINPKDMEDLREEYRIIREICQSTGHPNIVNVIDCIVEDQTMYIVYELASGGDLSFYLKEKGFFDQSVARPIAHQLFSGVSFIHRAGYLHRDIKPPNLLVLKNCHPLHIKISDLGLTVRRTRGYDTRGNSDELEMYTPSKHGTAGTDKYMCPEVTNGDEEYDYECDIWSCGVVLYQMLSGYMPFDDNPKSNEPFDSAEFPMPEWRGLEKASGLIKAIFARANDDDILPMTADQALDHEFFQMELNKRHPLVPNSNSAMEHFLLKTHLANAFNKLA